MQQSSAFSDEVRACAQRLDEHGVSALSGLFDLTSHRLLRLAVTVTRHQQDAEDAVQAALVKVAAQPRHVATADQPWHYLLRMVRNESLLILRQRKRVYAASNLSDLITHVSVDEAELEETHRAVWKALRGLPTSQSEVVVLKIWEGLTFAQISEVLSISGATAASRYRYAMEKLARTLAPQSPVHARIDRQDTTHG